MKRSAHVAIGRVGAGVVSQAVSVASNLLLIVAASQASGEREFGSFALLYGVVQFGVGFVRSTTADVASAGFSGDVESLSGVYRGVVSTALRRLVVLAGIVLVVSLVLNRGLGPIGLILALGTVPVGIHEVFRQLSFAALNPLRSIVLDLIWLATSVGIVALQLLLVGFRLDGLVGAWVLGATLPAGWLLNQARSHHSTNLEGWSGSLKANQRAFAGEFVLSRGVPELLAWILALTGGVAAAGTFRLAQSLVGPIAVLIGSARGTVMAELRRSLVLGNSLLRPTLLAGAGLSLVSVVYIVALDLVPTDWGQRLIGDRWEEVIDVARYLGWRRALVASTVAPFLLLRLTGGATRSTSLRALQAAVTVGLVALGAAAGGVPGVLVAFVVSGAAAMVIWWSQVRSSALKANTMSVVGASG